MNEPTHYDPEEHGHRKGRCSVCGYRGWSDDSGECPSCDSNTWCRECMCVTNHTTEQHQAADRPVDKPDDGGWD